MFELVLLAPENSVENVTDALIDELDALSVSVEDADVGTAAEQALFGEPGMPAPIAGWQRSVVRALFADDTAATSAATLLLAQNWTQGVHVQAIRPVPEQDWVRLTQSQFAGAARVIRLDPGLAFGTGTHPTTRMCLRWTAQQPASRTSRWQRVLDYGCGSGILAIGAALHGATGIDAVDIDPAAVESTRANALANGVHLNCGLPEASNGEYALVLANILATPLRLLAPLLCACVENDGDIVLAGILERQADELKAAYAPWLALQIADAEDGWILMTARRAA